MSSAELQKIKDGVPKKLSINDRFNYIAEKLCLQFGIEEIKNAPKLKNTIMNILGVEKSPIKLYEIFGGKKIEGTVMTRSILPKNCPIDRDNVHSFRFFGRHYLFLPISSRNVFR